MCRQHFWQFIFNVLLSLCLASSVNAKSNDNEEIEQALTAIGSGSAEEMKSRLFTHNITVTSAEFRAQAIHAISTTIRDQRIIKGKLLRRIELVFQHALQLHGPSGKVELFLFHYDIPLAQLWRGGVLMISDCLAEALYEGELAGLLAHELGRSYFEDEMAAAQGNQDTRSMRQVELKCDAIAILSLKLLGHNPTLYLRGLQRIQLLNKRQSRSSGIRQSHPDPVVRALFSQRFIKSLG
jgi:hypothetical protein